MYRCRYVVWIASGFLLAASGCGPGTMFNSGGSAAVSWTRFQDSHENAFAVEVPQGWKVNGGLFRLGYADVRLMVDMQSPDGKTDVRLGDVGVPTYTLPLAPNHTREGSVYDLGAEAQMVVARYRTGPEFAVLYAQARFAKACSNPQADPGDAQPLKMLSLSSDTNPTQTSAGQFAAHCTTTAGPDTAYTYAQTVETGGIWVVSSLASYITPSDQVAATWSVLQHAASSFQMNPQWIQYQKQMDAEGLQYVQAFEQQRRAALAAQVQQFEAQMRAMQDQVNAFERQQSAEAAQVQGFDNALVGVTPAVDPLTGEQRDVWTGPENGYWENGNGVVVNGNAPPPGGDWHQLQPKQ